MDSGRHFQHRHATHLTPLERRINAVGEALRPLVPYAIQTAVTMGAYSAGLAAAQTLGMAARVSCATPVLGPVGGLLGVGLASALAGQASLLCRESLHGGGRAGTPGPAAARPARRGWSAETLLVDAALGIALFKLMGGRFRSVMPSDLSRVGAIALESMPTRGIEYASRGKRRELFRFFKRDGCHHCGTRRGDVIGDHMPPNKLVLDRVEAMPAALRTLRRLPFVKEASEALGVHLGPTPQRYYPQCQPCALKQASAVKHGKTRLVFHQILHSGGRSSAWHWAGVVTGLRHHSSEAGTRGQRRAGSWKGGPC
ncbi:hypothetical protein ACKKBG_A35715 [Auxenochlorella protothecoides x Auxenochlorella symbiontica]